MSRFTWFLTNSCQKWIMGRINPFFFFFTFSPFGGCFPTTCNECWDSVMCLQQYPSWASLWINVSIFMIKWAVKWVLVSKCEQMLQLLVTVISVWITCNCDKIFAKFIFFNIIWAASSKFGTYSLCEQRKFRRACASMQSRQNLHCSLIQAVSQEEPSDRKPDTWPLWMAGHVQLKFVMTECWKTQIRLTGLIY